MQEQKTLKKNAGIWDKVYMAAVSLFLILCEDGLGLAEKQLHILRAYSSKQPLQPLKKPL